MQTIDTLPEEARPALTLMVEEVFALATAESTPEDDQLARTTLRAELTKAATAYLLATGNARVRFQVASGQISQSPLH